jgi:hypothetical protein
MNVCIVVPLNGAQLANGASVSPANLSISQKRTLSFAQTVFSEEAYAGTRILHVNASLLCSMQMDNTGVHASTITSDRGVICGDGTFTSTTRACLVYRRAMFDYSHCNFRSSFPSLLHFLYLLPKSFFSRFHVSLSNCEVHNVLSQR